MDKSRIVVPIKPVFGTPCNGCGRCCSEELCVIGEMAYPGASAPCPALKLTPDRSRTYCEIVAAEMAGGFEPIIANGLGIGKGCSMPDSPC